MGLGGVARHQQHLQLAGLQGVALLVTRRPPGEPAGGQPLVAHPEALAVVDEDLDRRAAPVAEDEQRPAEGVGLQQLPAVTDQTVDAGRRDERIRSMMTDLPEEQRSLIKLAFFDGLRSERLPANLLQAQRDYFGAHTYERVDKPRGEFFHTNWTGRGGDVTARTYNA